MCNNNVVTNFVNLCSKPLIGCNINVNSVVQNHADLERTRTRDEWYVTRMKEIYDTTPIF